ncbi:MAG: UDP-N-acetylmuramoyl-L-alanine--D-glutamate ligase [Chitinophagales bacterium]|nr:UDP-N-acetylmuramoyl-L-alanine--D-glutamate ligase [Chitinophagales bacterium]MDW8428741.1 UDP-N-acetylmuramoyl-L-alanine--D-glutamate ligase [Chitinophagales bacterium]
MNVVVIGAGESGLGAALLAKKLGHEVLVSDSGSLRPQRRQQLLQAGIPFEEGQHDLSRMLGADLIIKSPGIAPNSPVLAALRQQGIPIISEIEFAAQHTRAPVVAITGTNGKSTTATLTWHLLQRSGMDVALVGNIGKSFAGQLAEREAACYVAEVSSFQLEDCYAFKPWVAVITNITPNHLDRYEYSMQRYADTKFRITQAQDASDYLIYCADDAETRAGLERHQVKAQCLAFSQEKTLSQGAWLHHDQIVFSLNQNSFTMPVPKLGLRGKHNVYNSMAAGIVARLFDIKNDLIREALSDFRSLEHRLEWVADIKGVEFINDSKATSVNATWYALESINKPIIWIAGGVDKGNDYSMLTDLVRRKVKALVCLGVDNRKLHEAFSNSVDLIVNTNNMRDAVKAAFHLAAPGDCVLLSPACASFDLFENYEERGRQFKECVRDL